VSGMKTSMASELNPKLLDVVTLSPPSSESPLGPLTGTVVEVYASGALLVELSDESGVGRDFVTAPSDGTRVVWHAQQNAAPQKESPTNALKLFEEGMLLLQNGFLAEAKDKFAKSFDLDPDRARGLLNSTLQLVTSGAFDPAIVILRLIAELQPKYVLARENLAITHLNRGVYYANRGSLDKAVEDFTNALLIGTSPEVVNLARRDLAAAHTQIALRHIKIRRFDEALQLFLVAFQLEPSHDTRNNFALALVARSAARGEGRDVNEETFRQPMLMGLTLSECLNAYGAILAQLGEIARGQELLVRAITVDPGNESARKNLRALSTSDPSGVSDLTMWAAGPQLAELHATQ
jgi:tetratricopeptide (TPR) repeat protein